VKPKIFYLVTEDWYFCSHRLPLARAALAAGYDVGLITQVTRHGELIKAAGIRLFPIPFARSGRRPLRDLRTIIAIARIYRRERPDLVHHVSVKPILYGTLAAALCGIPRVVNAYTGLGFLFTSRRYSARGVRSVVTRIWRPLLARRSCWNLVQNTDDRALLQNRGLADADRTFLVRGSGVDLAEFTVTPENDGVPIIMLAARLLWDKGVGEFVAAARKLKEADTAARFVLVGEPDPENPMSVRGEELRRWEEEGCIEWWGRRDDMPEVLRQAHVVCLPSYREGLPKVLLEAAACGRAIVATDTPGCRDVVSDGENGLLVPVGDAAALAAAVRRLVDDSPLRREMGRCGRERVEREFSVARVVDDTLEAYRRILGSGPV
jgi:glycosyltransferase involved in cell wall biosynthesis